MKNLAPKETAEKIFRAALRAVDPYEAVMSRKEHILSAYKKGGFGRIVVVGFGKASYPMASAIEDTLGELIDTGIIITKYGHLGKRNLTKIRAFEAAHPVPDENGQKAAGELLQLLEAASEDTLVVCLISGGGSALLASPAEGISLAEKQEVTSALLRAGADINELNAVRKHISSVKGGRLAHAAYPAGVVSLIISDVIGDPLDVIASGPTAPDASTWRDAMDVIEKYDITSPENVIEFIRKGVEGHIPDSPKPGDLVFEKVENLVIGSNRLDREQPPRALGGKGGGRSLGIFNRNPHRLSQRRGPGGRRTPYLRGFKENSEAVLPHRGRRNHGDRKG
jgi:glycerate-2-kinase